MSKHFSIEYNPNIQPQPVSVILLPTACSQYIHINYCQIQETIPKPSDETVAIDSCSWAREDALPPNQTGSWSDLFLMQECSFRYWFSLLAYLPVYNFSNPKLQSIAHMMRGSSQSLMLDEGTGLYICSSTYNYLPHWNRNLWWETWDAEDNLLLYHSHLCRRLTGGSYFLVFFSGVKRV